MGSFSPLIAPEALELKPVGHRVKIRSLGRSMRPLLRSGDLLTVERCREESVRRGDVAVVKDERGNFLVHLVVSARPARTAAFYGALDPGKIEVLGRVTAIERSGLALPLPRASRRALWLARRFLIRASSSGVLHRAAEVFRALIAARATLPLRRRLVDPLKVRKLGFADLESLLIFSGQYLAASPEFLKRQLLIKWPRRGAGVGAFDRAGRLIGFAYLGELREEGIELDGFGIPTVFVVPAVRDLGLERQMVELLCAEAINEDITRVQVSIPEGQTAVLETFRAAGFEPTPPACARAVQNELGRHGRYEQFKLLERTVGNATLSKLRADRR